MFVLVEHQIAGILKEQHSSNPFQNSRPITRQQAIGLINSWLYAKREIFAPPYNQRKIEELTTGAFRQELLNPSGPINWLKINNAWYEYGSQTIEKTRLFATSKTGKAIIELSIVEYITYYENSRIIPRESGWKTTNVRYYLELSDNQWKISSYTIMQ
jgi:serine/threonine-protein kinase